MTTPTPIPDAMIEAAARAIRDALDDPAHPFVLTWEQLPQPQRELYLRQAHAALAAVLSLCESHTEDQIRGYHTEGEEWIHSYPRDPGRIAERLVDMRRDGYTDVGLDRRLAIFTPWEPVEDGESR